MHENRCRYDNLDNDNDNDNDVTTGAARGPTPHSPRGGLRPHPGQNSSRARRG